mgnify:CR=1 FL=1
MRASVHTPAHPGLCKPAACRTPNHSANVPSVAFLPQVRLHRHIAFCICSLTHSDKSVRKLQENFASFGNRLSDAEVYSYFTDLVARTRKSIAQQPELRPALDDFEKLLKASQSNTGPDEEGLAESPADLASHLAGQGADENVPPSQGQPEKRPAARAAQRGRRRGAA